MLELHARFYPMYHTPIRVSSRETWVSLLARFPKLQDDDRELEIELDADANAADDVLMSRRFTCFLI